MHNIAVVYILSCHGKNMIEPTKECHANNDHHTL